MVRGVNLDLHTRILVEIVLYETLYTRIFLRGDEDGDHTPRPKENTLSRKKVITLTRKRKIGPTQFIRSKGTTTLRLGAITPFLFL